MTHLIESREQRVLRQLLEFYSKESNFKTFLDIVVLKTRNIPLRVLDWFVTNFSKKNDISYTIKRPNNQDEIFCVYRSYRAQLKGCKKKEFDPFCRSEPIMLEYESPIDSSKVVFETAVCQLKFFKWAIENLLLDYITTHFEQIYDDMKNNSSKSQKNSSEVTVAQVMQKAKPTATKDVSLSLKKKNELSSSIFQQIHVSNQATVLNFGKKTQVCA